MKTETLELSIDGASCSVTKRGARCELRVITAPRGRDLDQLFGRIGRVVRDLARNRPLDSKVYAGMKHDHTTPHTFCADLTVAILSGDCTVYRINKGDRANPSGSEEVSNL